jgi:DNA helicase-2/ATP-dependent DNA helicase PcrA
MLFGWFATHCLRSRCQVLENFQKPRLTRAAHQRDGRLQERPEFINDPSGKFETCKLVNESVIKPAPICSNQTAADKYDSRSVAFMTIHSSKGLTMDTAVLPGFERAWCPGNHCGEELAEERRLYYVAITRARSEVLITYPKQKGRGDPLNYARPGRGECSPFIRESDVPHEHIW